MVFHSLQERQSYHLDALNVSIFHCLVLGVSAQSLLLSSIVEENGKTGWPTIYALIRALQIELGIQVTADNFGNGTINAFKAKYPTGIHQQADGDETEDKVYGIIQGALLCKGYATGVSTPTLHFYNGTGNAIKQMKEDAGIDSSSSTVTLNIMKALLSMDYFYSYDTSAKTQNIQAIQRFLNANYESYIGLTPCDGVYGRGTNKALIFALQKMEVQHRTPVQASCWEFPQESHPQS